MCMVSALYLMAASSIKQSIIHVNSHRYDLKYTDKKANHPLWPQSNQSVLFAMLIWRSID